MRVWIVMSEHGTYEEADTEVVGVFTSSDEDLKQFWAWCESFPVTPLDVDKIHVQLYLEHLQAKGLAQATAMRVGEVLPLNADSIHRDPGRAWVGFTGKGAKYAEITLDYPTLTGVDRYLDGRSEGPLFLNEWGNRLTRLNVQTILTRISLDAGVAYHVTPHGIRRTHAKTAAEQGEDLLGIAESLRHVDSRVTRQSYIGLDSGRGALTRQRVSSVYAQMSG